MALSDSASLTGDSASLKRRKKSRVSNSLHARKQSTIDDVRRASCGSSTGSSATTLDSLPFLQRLSDIAGKPHYRLLLDVDGTTEEATSSSPFDSIASPIPEFTLQITKNGSIVELLDDGNDEHSHKNDGFRKPVSSRRISAKGRGLEDPIGQWRNIRDQVTPISPTEDSRSFQNLFFRVERSSLGGYGAFASRDISWNQIVLTERALFRANSVSVYDEIDTLAPELKEAFLSLHAYSPISGIDKMTSTFRTNSFRIGKNLEGIFLVAARFNHACPPRNNITYMFDQHRDCIVLSASRDIKIGEELTIVYGRSPEELYANWGFVCRCGGCASLTEEQVCALENPHD